VVVNRDVDAYIGRSKKWPAELSRLRDVLLDAGLTEEIKWAKPCYCYDGQNVVILQEMKDFLALMFFKGALLNDPHGVLEDQGPNSRSARRMTFISVDDVDRLGDTVREYVREAIDVEKVGLEVGPAPEPVLVEELRDRLDQDAALRAAFMALTPGRRREYNMHFSDAKQATTRESRIDKHISGILHGKGLRDR
jgi:uncharacterized protein YdeI (YjbR/CyaY-like superfamily)